MKHLIAKPLLLLAGVVLLASEAQATLTYSDEDIVVAFSNQPTPNHSGNTYLVNLGPALQFKAGGSLATGSPMSVNAPNAAALLTDLIAAGITSANRTWSLQGANINILDSFLSRQRPSQGIPSTPWINGLGIGQGNTSILTLMYSFGPAAAPSTVPNSFIQDTLNDPSYARLVFGTTSPTLAYEAWGNPEAPLAGLLDLYQITDGTGDSTRLGSFDFNSSTGLIRFTSEIPEPSTTLLLLLSVGAFSARRNRRPLGHPLTRGADPIGF